MYKSLTIILLALLALTSCNKKVDGVPDAANAVYYWRTTLQFDSTERQFLTDHKIGKMYVRFFDVVLDESEDCEPNATLQFTDSIPDGVEVIPTVFITENCLKQNIDDLPSLIVKRVLQMCETNDIAGVKEMQIDCDWTKNSQNAYFNMLSKVRQLLEVNDMRLSVTIRLHQLNMTPPPADYGVLMMYNTGDPTNRQCENPILGLKEVEPYLKYVDNYELPLCVAYPNFGWKLLFQGETFKSILYDADLNDTTLYRRMTANNYMAISSRGIATGPGYEAVDTHINPGDVVLVKEVPFALIKRVHDLLGEHRSNINNQVIFYDLKTENIKRYKPNEYETIYHP